MKRPEWSNRRKVLYVALIFNAIWISYILGWGEDSEVNQQAILALIGAQVMMVGSYVFGAVWDDKNYMSIMKKDSNNDYTYYEPIKRDFNT